MKTYLFIILLCFTSACEMIVDVDVPIEEPKMTLNSFIIQDSVWTAKLSLNRHILEESDFKTVDDGLIVIYAEGNPLDTLAHEDNGMYIADSKPGPGSYEIRVTSPRYGSARSQSYLPTGVGIDDIGIKMPEDPKAGGSKISIRFNMKDPAMETNYYQVLLYTEDKYIHHMTGQEIINYRPMRLESNDPAIANENLNTGEGLFFKDVLFNGKNISMALEAPYWRHNDKKIKLFFYLRTLSEDFYKYKITSLLQNHTSGDPFAQPASVYTNIENGFGIFAGFSQSVFLYQE